MTNTGGSSKGTIRFKEELSHGANAGLDKAVAKLEPLKEKYPCTSPPHISQLHTRTWCLHRILEAMGKSTPCKLAQTRPRCPRTNRFDSEFRSRHSHTNLRMLFLVHQSLS